MLGVVLLTVCASSSAWAQVATGTVSGVTRDSTGGVLPGVTVTVKNVDTGQTRVLVTDADGRYRAPNVPLGGYEVSAELSGFRPTVRRGIRLSVGQEGTVDLVLDVGQMTDEVTVMAEVPLVETTKSEIGGLVNQEQMRELPLNARSYEQLALLQPNVFQQRAVFSTTNTGYTPKISAGGMRSGVNAYLVDGIDVIDTTGQTPGSVAGQLMGVETLREIKVLTNNFSAQYGRALGAVISVASRGGANDFHGTAFEFLRTDALDTKGYFDAEKLPFRRDQYGGVFGGRIVRNRAFFFVSYEALRERLTNSNTVYVPTVAARQGILSSGTIEVAAAAKPFLALYPVPQQDLGGGIGTYTFPFEGRVDTSFYSARVDYQHSQNVSYFARYSLDDTEKVQRRGPAVIPPWAEGLRSFNQTLTFAETRVLSPRLLNEFRFGFVRYTPKSSSILTGPDPNLEFPNVLGQGVLSLTSGFTLAGASLANLGSPGRPFEDYSGDTYQITNDVSYNMGAHSLRFGMNLERFHDNVGKLTETGRYQHIASFEFESLEALLRATPRSFGGRLSSEPVGIRGRQWLLGFYAQDDYKLRPNLTLNLGLRWESASNYQNLDKSFIILNDLFGTPRSGQEYAWAGWPCLGCFNPRVGFAWDIGSDQRTVLRGGGGVFHSQLVRFAGYYHVPTGQPGGVSISVDNPSFPDPTVPNPTSVIRTAPTQAGSAGVTILPETPRTPAAVHWNLTVDRQLRRATTVRLAYVGSRGYHLDGGYVVNTTQRVVRDDGSLFFLAGAPRIRPDFGATEYAAYDFNSYYHALTATVAQRLRAGLRYEASYAYSKNIDETTLGRAQGAHLTAEARMPDGNRSLHRGRSGLDMRHRFVANFGWDVPSPAANGFVGQLLSGWQVNGIVTLQAGTPFTPLIGFDRAGSRGTAPASTQRVSMARPGPVPICPCNGVTAPAQYFDPTVFSLPPAGTYGNAGRNIIIGPGYSNLDLALSKRVPVGQTDLLFRVEGFNIFNRANFSQPNSQIFLTSGAVSPTAGRITSVSSPPRQFQLSVKVSF